VTTFVAVIDPKRPFDLLADRRTGKVRALTPAGEAYVRAEQGNWPNPKLSTEGERFVHAIAVAMVAREKYALRIRFVDGEVT